MEAIVSVLRNGACVIKDLSEFFPDHSFTTTFIKSAFNFQGADIPYANAFVGILQVRRSCVLASEMGTLAVLPTYSVV